MRFKWNLLGYGFCRIWQVQSFTLMTEFGNPEGDPALFWLCATIAALFIVPIVSLRSSARAQRSRVVVLFATLGFLGIVTLPIGIAFSLPWIYRAGIVCSGAGLSLLWLLWADRFAALETPDIYRYTIVDIFMMICFDVFANLVCASNTGNLILFIMCPVASLLLLMRDFQADGNWENELVVRGSSERPTFRSVMGLCIVIFAFPFVYHLSTAFLYSGIGFLERDAGDLLSLAVFVAILWASKRTLSLTHMYRIAIPLILLGLLLCRFLPAEAPALNAVLAGSGSKVASLFFWVLLLEMARKSDRTLLILSGGLGAMFAGNALALFSDLLVPASVFDPTDGWVVTSLVIILVCVAFWTLPNLSKSDEGEEQRAFAAGSEDSEHSGLSDQCAFLASQHALTNREAEVFALLAQGRSQATIARMLVIGEGTVHSHILHVYQKLDVHSQQELIDLVHDAS